MAGKTKKKSRAVKKSVRKKSPAKKVNKSGAVKRKIKTAPKASKKPVAKKTPKRSLSVKAAKPPLPTSPDKVPALPWRHPLPGETFVGVVDDYYGHLSVVTLTLKAGLQAGDKIHARGHTTDVVERLESMQINHAPVPSAKIGDEVGIKMVGKCRAGDYLYKIVS